MGRGHGKFKAETRKLAFKNVKIRKVEAWREEAAAKLDRRQLHGHTKLLAKTWLNFLVVDDEWKDSETNLRWLKKRSLSETTEEEGEDLINLEEEDDEMDVDADIPADDDDEVQVMDTLDETMMDDLAEARQKGTWVKKGTVKKEEPDIINPQQLPRRPQQPNRRRNRAQGLGPPEHGHERHLELSLRRLTMRREPVFRYAGNEVF